MSDTPDDTATTNPLRLALDHLQATGHAAQIEQFLPGIFAFRIDHGPELTPTQFLQAAWQVS